MEKHKNWHQKHQENLTTGDRIADSVTNFLGSWKGIIISNIIVAFWITLNVTAYIQHWDPYPFILLNLVFSWQAYNAAPLILMHQNRDSKKDKIQAEHQYEHQEKELKVNTNLTSEVHKLTKAIHAYLLKEKE